MATRFKKGNRQRHFIAQWRRFRGLSQDQLADRLGTSKATLSRIENRIIPYNQDFLEACAEELQCTTADLIMRDPTTPEPISAIWENIPASERPRVTEILRLYGKPAN
jgi:transcriptional regulator with XRE-family HTH domain